MHVALLDWQRRWHWCVNLQLSISSAACLTSCVLLHAYVNECNAVPSLGSCFELALGRYGVLGPNGDVLHHMRVLLGRLMALPELL